MGDVIVPPPPPALGQASWSKYNRSPSLKKSGSFSEAVDRRPTEGSQRRSSSGRMMSSYTSNVTNDPTPPKSIQLSGIPIPLKESDVSNDLQDVITALGVNPQDLGLRIDGRRAQSADASVTASSLTKALRQSPPPSSSYDHSGKGFTRRLDESKSLSVSSSSISSVVDMSSVEKRLQDLVSAALESPVRQRRI